MRRSIATTITAIIIFIISWTLPYYIEVNGMITPENSHWLLYGSVIGMIIMFLVLGWGFWPFIKRIRFQTPIKSIGGQGESKTENSKVEKKSYIFRSMLMISDQYTHKCTQCDYGVVVNKWDMGVVCPKCGNADDITPRL